MLARFRTLLFAIFTCLPATANPGFFRQPAIHGDTIIFTAEGDLWKCPLLGGPAQRLTTHRGVEVAATISPDGALLAFSAQYDGPSEVYVMPIDGGLPQRLTWHGGSARPVGWTPDSRVIVSSMHHSTLPSAQLSTIDPASPEEQIIQLAQADQGTFTADGNLYFTRLAPQHSNTKRYQGGTAQNLWRFDAGAAEAIPLTADFPGTSRNPMWWNDKLYFLSDRSGTINLWSTAADGSDPVQLTHHSDFDIRTAALEAGRIVYQQAGSIHIYDIAAATDQEIPITLTSDFDQTRIRPVAQPFDFLTRFDLSADGEKLALTARGSVFVVPVKSGARRVEIPRENTERFREAIFMPDDKSLLAQTDATGEIELVQIPVNGIGEKLQITNDGEVYRFAPSVSPDGTRVAWRDKNLDLWVRDIAAGQSVRVATMRSLRSGDIAWAPDSQWLAYVAPAANTFPQIILYHVADGSSLAVTSDQVISGSPAWSADGKWLYFLSDRELRSAVSSPWGHRQPEPYFTQSTRIYALALQPGTRFPFTPPNELTAESSPEETPIDDPEPVSKLEIEPVGLARRLYEIPGIAGNLDHLTVTPKHIFYSVRDSGLDPEPRLVRIEINDRKINDSVFARNLQGWAFSADKKSIALRTGNRFHVVPTAGESPAKLDQPVPLDDWTLLVDPREEWLQIFHESWRMLRDFFYDPAMHGLDWPAIRLKYLPLVARVADRSDLNEILQEMSGELETLHMFVRYGDLRGGDGQLPASSLGATISFREDSEAWEIARIYQGDPEYPNEISPLAIPEVALQPGDFIVSIDGIPLDRATRPEPILQRKAGRQVLLQVRRGNEVLPREVLVNPLDVRAAAELRYADWEFSRREIVEKAGSGTIGYVHLRDMGGASILQWARQYYPVFNRQGLIIDVRHNRGGNTDSWILGRLMRKAWFMWAPRTGDPYWNMQYAFRGHMTVLCDEWTASDGEAFAEGFRRLGLGKIIGTRSWGGEIWLNSQRWLIDNGMATAAENGVYGPEGDWLIEGVGVIPDIVVDNLPHATFIGGDAQLDAAITHLNELIAADPRPVPPIPSYPNKALPPPAPRDEDQD